MVRVEGVHSGNRLGISVRNLAGQTVFYTPAEAKGNRYETFIPLKDAPRGMYFVELELEGARTMQRVLLE